MGKFKLFWSTISHGSQALFTGAFLILLMGAGLGIWSVFLKAELSDLKENEKRLQSQYDKLLGESKAHEQAAQEYKLKADALASAIEQSKANVKAIDDKIIAITEKYEKEKANLDCGDDCARQLCYELRAGGYAVTCPEGEGNLSGVPDCPARSEKGEGN